MIWTPRSEDELRSAIGSGLLVENRYLDLKREPPALTDGGNKELAKDVAAFALEGGTIVIGVDEGPPLSLHPFELAGVAERVEQVAAMRVQEGVAVTTLELESATSPDCGYLIVRVPASPRAPHMADGKYYGRGDKANRPLSHAEVLRIHQQQHDHQQDIIQAARHELEKFLDGTSTYWPLLVVLGQPLGPPVGMLKPLSAMVGQWHAEVIEMLRKAGVESQRSFDPNFGSTSSVRRAGGVAVRTHTAEGRRFEDKRAAEIHLRESGVLVLGSRRPVMEAVQQGGEEYVFEELIVKHTELLVRLSGVISDRFGFAGSWRFGLVVTGLRDKTSWVSHAKWPRHSDPYSDDEYAESAAASLEEIRSAPQRVVEDLVGPLLRSLNSRTLFPELDEGQAPPC